MSSSAPKLQNHPLLSSIVLKAILARLGRLTASTAGLDAIFKTVDYSAPLVVATLLSLAKLSARLRAGGGVDLTKKAAGWTKAVASVKETRVIIRAAGLIPVIQGLLALYPHPVDSLKSLLTGQKVNILSNPKTIPTIQVFSLLGYYAAEHVYWLGEKGVLDVSPSGLGTAAKILIQSWAVYVVFAVYKLVKQFFSLRRRTEVLERKQRSLKNTAAAEGYELQEKAEGASAAEPSDAATELAKEAATLRSDWEDFTASALVYVGYGPMTVHWVRPWITNPFVYSLLGTISGIGSLMGQWKAAAA